MKEKMTYPLEEQALLQDGLEILQALAKSIDEGQNVSLDDLRLALFALQNFIQKSSFSQPPSAVALNGALDRARLWLCHDQKVERQPQILSAQVERLRWEIQEELGSQDSSMVAQKERSLKETQDGDPWQLPRLIFGRLRKQLGLPAA